MNNQEKSPASPEFTILQGFLWNPVTKILGSLPFALGIMILLTVVMAWATRIDALYGAQVSAWAFYRSGWFIALNGLLGVSVLCAMFNPRRWVKRKIGFLLVHIGIIVLLLGCALSLISGWEADLTVYEGCQRDFALKANHQVQLRVFRENPAAAIERENVQFDNDANPAPAADSAKAEKDALYSQLYNNWITFPVHFGPFSWQEYNKLGAFPWGLVRPQAKTLHSGAIDGVNTKIEVLDFRKPFREIFTGDSLAVSIRPAKMEETQDSLSANPTAGDWTQITLQASRNINQGLIGRSRLTGGQQISFRKLRSEDELAAFLRCIPETTIQQDTFIFYYRGKKHVFTLNDFLPQGKMAAELRTIDPQHLPSPALDENARLTLVNWEESMGAAIFDLSLKNEAGEFQPVNSLTLLNLLSEFNRSDVQNGVYGEYYRPDKAVNNIDSPEDSMTAMRNKLIGPRLEIASDASGNLFYRSIINNTVESGALPTTHPFLAFGKTPYAAGILPLQDAPGVRFLPVPLEEQKPSENDAAAALVKITFGKKTVERWLTLGVNNPLAPPECYRSTDFLTVESENSQGEKRWLTFSLPREKALLGFNVLLERFNRRLDPGTSMPSHYSSDVTVSSPKYKQKKFNHVRIQLNEPVNFVNPENGRSYRLYQSSFNGPLEESSPLTKWVYSHQVEKTNRAAPLYSSTFTVNYDSGRGLLYLGCLLICAGIGAMYYLGKPKEADNPPTGCNRNTKTALLFFALILFTSPAFSLDYSTLESIPVLESGRIQPLNTVAINTVKSICGTESPVITLEGANITGELNAQSAAQITRHFTNSPQRKFSPMELYWLWQIEPEVWEHIPFLECKNPDLRRLLGVPLLDKSGRALRYVSPRQVSASPALPEFRYNMDLLQQQQQRAGITHQSTALEKSVLKLFSAMELYRGVTFYPPASENPRERSAALVGRILQNQMTDWLPSVQNYCRESQNAVMQKAPENFARYGESLRKIFMTDVNSPDFARLDRSLSSIRHLIELYESQLNPILAELDSQKVKDASLIKRLRQAQADLLQLRYSLYDEGSLPGVVPSLNPAALDLWRDLDSHNAVWITVPTLLYGDNIVLGHFAETDVARFKSAWAAAAQATIAGNDQAFVQAQTDVAAALKELGYYANRQRSKLLPENRLDKQAESASLYPATPLQTNLLKWELYYYGLKPFNAALILSALAALIYIALSFIPEKIRSSHKFLLGFLPALPLMGAVGFSGFGLALRGYIMSRSPIANMFETIMFVAFMTGFMGLILPVLQSNPQRLYRAWENTKLNFRSAALSYWIVQILRWTFAAVLFYAMVFVSYGAGSGYSAVSLLPRLAYGAVLPSVSDIFVWISSLLLLACVALYLPRTLVLPFTLAGQMRGKDEKTNEPESACNAQQTPRNSTVAPLCASALMCLLIAAATHAPMFNDDLKNLMPILRDNFWLAIHVISIVGGYGTAMLAWILGNAVLLQIILQTSGGRKLDEIPGCENQNSSLSSLIYLCIQATIWLLAIGIILGGLWADVSWGRFWSWDRKEVWALISLFVYLIFMHARHWGWFGKNREITLALAAVSGALAILMAWYGVNYLLGSAMHGYASGSGGLAPAIAFVSANAAFAALALTRYLITRKN